LEAICKGKTFFKEKHFLKKNLFFIIFLKKNYRSFFPLGPVIFSSENKINKNSFENLQQCTTEKPPKKVNKGNEKIF
jgi:hypothetical protein